MKLIDTMIESIRFYPRVHSSKWEVLHHLFCVIGNGYEWKKGGLVRKSKHLDREASMTEKGALDILCYNGRFPMLYKACVEGEIFNLPDDIQPDWFWGAEQMVKKIEHLNKLDYEALCRVHYMEYDKLAFELNIKTDISVLNKWKKEIKRAKSRLEFIKEKRGFKFREQVLKFDTEYRAYMVKAIYGSIKPATQIIKEKRAKARA